jgi:hypothetical protein
MDSQLVFSLFLLVAVLFAGAMAMGLLFPIVREHFKGSPGGWAALAGAYATTVKPTGEIWRGQSIVAGKILYRSCVTVGIDRAGLYLAVTTPLRLIRKPPLVIPWGAFQRVEPARLFWRKATLISLGTPTVGTLTVPTDLYACMRPYLPEPLASFGTPGGLGS